MAFAAVQFEDDNGPPTLVNSGWLTPRKREVFWPPFKRQKLFDEAIKKQPDPAEAWRLYRIKRIFFRSDDYESAKRKLNKLEDTLNDAHSSDDDSQLLNQTKRRLPQRKRYGSDDDADDESSLHRPAKMIKCETVPQSNSVETEETVTLSKPTTPNLRQTTNSSPSPYFNTQPISPPSNNFSIEGDLFADEPISSSSTSSSEFQEKVLKMLEYVKEQNSQILSILRTQVNTTNSTLHFFDDLPFDLPLTSENGLQQLEEYISDKDNYSLMLNHLSSFGGNNLTSRTNKILQRILRTEFACNFNFCGRNGKTAFTDFKLKSLVVDAVKANSPDDTINRIEDSIKTWLKHAPQKLKMQAMKQSNE